MNENNEVTPIDIKTAIIYWWGYLMSKIYLLLIAGIGFGIVGVIYAWRQKPTFIAEVTFAPENEKGATNMYAGIAAQFGFDLGSGGDVFEGENLMQFLKSKMLIEKALLSPVVLGDKQDILINYYITSHEVNKDWNKDPLLKTITFSDKKTTPSRARDSVMNKVLKKISDNLEIEKLSKNANIVSVRFKDHEELFPKLFVEKLVETGIEYYTSYRSEKTKRNIQILQRQTDSVHNLLTGNIIAVAESNDLNVNPIKQVVRTGSQRKQVDVQVNGQLYGEFLKQLEVAKISLRKETPFIQVLDRPRLPLEKKKIGRVKAGILFAFFGTFFMVAFLVVKRIFSNNPGM